MNRKRALGILCLVCVAVGLVAGFLWYKDFVMSHRSEIIFLCTIGAIVSLWFQCGSICEKTTKQIDELISGAAQQNTLQNNAQSQPNKS